ncbi:MAG: L-2-amino-thiazoline-4-carboxylic acid hydrolase [Eubacteriales bacterium]|nr:L-2-amino-thiazoline-4-carboxylic acid hydrolase [Eubacteriales bacterium]
MREKDLPIDRSKHKVYTRNARKCVLKLLRSCYDREETAELWKKIQLQYAEYLKDEPALKDLKVTASIYDPILIFAWYVSAERKPPREEIQRAVCDSFFGSFNVLGRIFDLNRRRDNRLANRIFKMASDIRVEEIKRFPASFRMGFYDYDETNGVVRYSFTQCPNAEFARRHHLEDALPLMCNCDHLAMQKLHACLIREGTCGTSDRCDYCICGDQNPLAKAYELVRTDNGLLLSVKKAAPDR